MATIFFFNSKKVFPFFCGFPKLNEKFTIIIKWCMVKHKNVLILKKSTYFSVFFTALFVYVFRLDKAAAKLIRRRDSQTKYKIVAWHFLAILTN